MRGPSSCRSFFVGAASQHRLGFGGGGLWTQVVPVRWVMHPMLLLATAILAWQISSARQAHCVFVPTGSGIAHQGCRSCVACDWTPPAHRSSWQLAALSRRMLCITPVRADVTPCTTRATCILHSRPACRVPSVHRVACSGSQHTLRVASSLRCRMTSGAVFGGCGSCGGWAWWEEV